MKTKMIGGYPFEEYRPEQYSEAQIVQRSKDFLEWICKRRSVRHFSDRPVPRAVIDAIIMTASAAPSGAHKQPWTFCVVRDPAIKKQIREAAEKEEYESYHTRMNDEWLEALKPLQTDWLKPFLETAPYLIVVFKKAYNLNSNGSHQNNYYVHESVGLACGFLLAAIHHAGLVALTHTPSPMNFLTKILNRPENERPYLLIPVGHVAEEAYVPALKRKSLDEVAVYY